MCSLIPPLEAHNYCSQIHLQAPGQAEPREVHVTCSPALFTYGFLQSKGKEAERHVIERAAAWLSQVRPDIPDWQERLQAVAELAKATSGRGQRVAFIEGGLQGADAKPTWLEEVKEKGVTHLELRGGAPPTPELRIGFLQRSLFKNDKTPFLASVKVLRDIAGAVAKDARQMEPDRLARFAFNLSGVEVRAASSLKAHAAQMSRYITKEASVKQLEKETAAALEEFAQEKTLSDSRQPEDERVAAVFSTILRPTLLPEQPLRG